MKNKALLLHSSGSSSIVVTSFIITIEASKPSASKYNIIYNVRPAE